MLRASGFLSVLMRNYDRKFTYIEGAEVFITECANVLLGLLRSSLNLVQLVNIFMLYR